MIKSFLVFSLLILFGCSPAPLKPGRSFSASTPQSFNTQLAQPENPASTSTQTTEETIEPQPLPLPPPPELGDTSNAKIALAEWMRVYNMAYAAQQSNNAARIVRKTSTTIGAAQKDDSRGISAYLKGVKDIMYVGIVLMIFGVASMFYPPLKALVNSSTLSMALIGLGAALTIVPMLVSDPKIRWLIALAGIGAACYLYLHTRNAHKQGFIDANNNGIDDREEKPETK